MTGTWSVVSGHDLAGALTRVESSGPVAWPAVLRPDMRPDMLAERSDRGDHANASSYPPVPDRRTTAGASREPSARLVSHALRAAVSAPVRAVHWLLHPRSTVIAESAHGPGQSVILVGRVPHAAAAAISAEPIVDPGLLLLGMWATPAACARLADLAGPAQDASATAVLTRWVLPAECTPLPARLVTDLRADRLERALITDLAAALARVQASGAASSTRARA